MDGRPAGRGALRCPQRGIPGMAGRCDLVLRRVNAIDLPEYWSGNESTYPPKLLDLMVFLSSRGSSRVVFSSGMFFDKKDTYPSPTLQAPPKRNSAGQTVRFNPYPGFQCPKKYQIRLRNPRALIHSMISYSRMQIDHRTLRGATTQTPVLFQPCRSPKTPRTVP